MSVSRHYHQMDGKQDQDAEFRAQDTFSFRDESPAKRWNRQACMATKDRHALAVSCY
jgi:hypothetical protein